ncbi:hypothetical protein ABT237_41670 [Streptomyces sp. NPDC001581]
MDEVRVALADAGTAVVGQVLAGMGGVGKTQLGRFLQIIGSLVDVCR